jgi:ZIP family zinc transporter
MAAPVGTAMGYALVPVAALVAGGAVAAFRPPSPSWRSAIQHFAAGVVFAVVAVELLPDLRKRHDPWEIALSFGLGVAVMLGLRRLTGEGEAGGGEEGGWSWGMLFAVGVDLLIDGLLLGVGFAAGAREGVLLALALAGECLSLGLAVAATLGRDRATPRWKVVAAPAGLALVFAAAAACGVTLLAGVSGHALTWVLAFGCAALLYLVTEELLVEAHEVPETSWATAAFFGGFLIFLVLGMYE